MGESFAFVRPYPGRLGAQIQEFLQDQGYELARNGTLPAGTLDDSAARFIVRARVSLIALPFHLHRGPRGEVLDGIGALLAMEENAEPGSAAIFMPVRSFSWGASFQRRLDLLRQERPWLFDKLLVAHQDDIGTATLAARLRRFVANRDQDGPPISLRSMRSHVEQLAPRLRHPSVMPPSDMPTSGVSRTPQGESVGLELEPVLGPASASAEPLHSASAVASFRRAAEIGARARRDASGARLRQRRDKG